MSIWIESVANWWRKFERDRYIISRVTNGRRQTTTNLHQTFLWVIELDWIRMPFGKDPPDYYLWKNVKSIVRKFGDTYERQDMLSFFRESMESSFLLDRVLLLTDTQTLSKGVRSFDIVRLSSPPSKIVVLSIYTLISIVDWNRVWHRQKKKNATFLEEERTKQLLVVDLWMKVLNMLSNEILNDSNSMSFLWFWNGGKHRRRRRFNIWFLWYVNIFNIIRFLYSSPRITYRWIQIITLSFRLQYSV
jgi:hypothetical protein